MAIDTQAVREAVEQSLKVVQDPEIRIGIVDLGLVYDINVTEQGLAQIKMTLTTPACPYGEMLLGMTHQAAEKVEGVERVEVILVWDPPWDPKDMASDLAKDQLGIW